MERLNRDVLYYIAMKLELKDLFNLSLTCKRMYFDDYFWRNKIKYDFPQRSNFKSLEYKELYLKKPKQLYNIINSKSKIITLREEDFPNLVKYIGKKENLFLLPDETLNNASKELENLSILRGDIIKLEWLNQYFDAFKLFWDGEKLALVNFEINDYGNIPRIFTFPEFPIDHFTESMESSSFRSPFENAILIWLSDLSITEAIKNFNKETQKSRINDCYILGHELEYQLSSENFSEFIKEKRYISKFINGEYIIGDNFWETIL